MRSIVLAFVFITIGFSSGVIAQDTSIYLKKVFIRGNDSMQYRMLLPRDYDSSKKYPLVLFLHGAGERGNDNIKQLTHGSQLFLQGTARRRFPAIVVFPQCPETDYWSNVQIATEKKTNKRSFVFQAGGEPTKAMDLTMELQKNLMQTMPVDSSKIYVMGLSMGGMGTFEIVRRMPTVFAAAIPICGGADSSTAKDIKKTAFWIFHGANDDVVPVKFSENMVSALQGFYNRADMQYTVYSGIGHNSWDRAFAEPELLRWLFAQRREK
ncbi:MAG: alpha/beta hydrolase-fold protein [Bacteroidota bacterium]